MSEIIPFKRITYVQVRLRDGLSHDERMALAAAGCHHDYWCELVEVPAPGSRPSSGLPRFLAGHSDDDLPPAAA